MNRRGLSEVITTVLIILVVLAAIVLIWAAVRPTIQNASEQITAACITLDLEVTECDAGAVIVDSGTCSIAVGTTCTVDVDCPVGETCENLDFGTDITVKRNVGQGELTALKFVFSDGDVVDTTDVQEGSLVDLGELESLLFTLVADDYNGQKVNVAAVIGAQETVCPEGSHAAKLCS